MRRLLGGGVRVHASSKVIFFLLLIGLLWCGPSWAQTICSPTGNEYATTDKEQYAPGATVLITGAGYQPSCTVLGRVTNIRIVPGDDKQATIQFAADWTGSWRNDSNHDAAWIFFKVRPEGAKEWQHIRLAAEPPPLGSSGAASRVLNPKGYASEGNRKMDFLVPAGEDGYTGMFVRQAGQSSPCSIVLTNVTAVWDLSKSKGIGRDTKVQIIAVCLKMVYIAEGPFYLGSGGTEPAGWYEFPESKKERAATFGSTNANATIVAHEGADNSAELGVVERGTATRVQVLKRSIAGKTGTTNKTRDAWFVGFTPSLVTGVWVGMDDERSLGPKETGSQAAAPIFIAYMREALKNQPVEHFREAAPTVLAGGREAAGRDEEAVDDQEEVFYPDEEAPREAPAKAPSSTQQFFKSDLDG